MLGLGGVTTFTGFITTLLTGITGLLMVYFPKAAPEALGAPPGGGPPALGSWLFPFGGATLLGTLLGLVLQTNHALDFSSPDLRKQYHAQGFTDDQINLMMDAHAKKDLSSQDLRARYRAQGFTDDQINLMMNAHAKAVTSPPPGVPSGPVVEPPANIQKIPPLKKKDDPGGGVGTMP